MSPSGCSTKRIAPRRRPSGRSCRRNAHCCSGARAGSNWRLPSSTGRWHGSTRIRSRSIWSRRSTTAASSMSKPAARARPAPICCAAATSRTGTDSRSSARQSGSTWAASTFSPATCRRRCARSRRLAPPTRPWPRVGLRRSRGRTSPGAARRRPVRRGRPGAGRRGCADRQAGSGTPACRGAGGPRRGGPAGRPRPRGGRPRAPGAGGVPGPRKRPPRGAGRAAGPARRVGLRPRHGGRRSKAGAGIGRSARPAGAPGGRPRGRFPSRPDAGRRRPGRGLPNGSPADTGRPAAPTGSIRACCGGLPAPTSPPHMGAARKRPGISSRGWPPCTTTAPSWAASTCRPAPRCTAPT